MADKVWLSSPHMGGEEIKFVQEAFVTNWISPVGPHIQAFELDLCKYNQIGYAAALGSGTAAIHLALIILGVNPGDEVICSTFTFSGSANPIAYQGANPVYVDSEELSWNMDPELLENCIKDRLSKGRKPKAIILVHLYGMPAQVEEIKRIANKYQISLVEDAAESLGATVNGKKTGTFGVMGIYSFNGNKIITTSGGGALVSNNAEFIEKAKFLATQARDQAPHYQHSHIGYNYRLSNISAGIGRGQMMVLDERISQRRAIYQQYEQRLSDLPGVSFLKEPAGYFANRWLTTILIDPLKSGGINREKIRLALDKNNIESRPLWKPMHAQPIFSKAEAYLNGVSDRLFDQGLCLPSGSNTKTEDIERTIEIIRTSF